jgi:glycosyltransferase involved in cell wall biosynthesis
VRILLSTWSLAQRTGAELHLVELAGALGRLGCDVTIHAVSPGPLAEQVRAEGLTLASRLDGLAPPDLICAHTAPALIEALLAFPAAPALQVIHDATAPLDAPYPFHRVQRHLAVDRRCLGRIAAAGIEAERQAMLLNFVDLERFRPRPPLPERPRRALVFSNYAQEGPALAAIRTACSRAGLELEVVGLGVGAVSAAPERLLGQYDIVFAKARAAIEAMATGCAVVLCDFAGLGPMVTRGEFDHLREWNFGAGVLTGPITVEGLSQEIARYDCADAADVARAIREQAGLKASAVEWLALMREAADAPFRADRATEILQLRRDLRRWAGLRRVDALRERFRGLRGGLIYRMGQGLWRALGSPGEMKGEPRTRS